MEQGSWPEPRAWGARGFCCGLEGMLFNIHVLSPFSFWTFMCRDLSYNYLSTSLPPWDVAVKVFFKQEYPDDVLLSFRQQVPLISIFLTGDDVFKWLWI
ncbi:uncharacterized protein LOC133740079 isoform X2 [Rosa rugosa]|uniref:uncharacterized protein LOC133740079 isoform X2 n=1 Tax=Rosa rugosa TaxID=74645 RepID=UPI002B414BA5|nr:uncharacterized protein LOC133740079 isoform X2 [Rosa rugosa]